MVRSRGSMPISGVDVALDARGAQLAQRLGGRAGQARLRPGAAGQAEHGELVGLEGDVGQRVLALVDAVARLVLEEGSMSSVTSGMPSSRSSSLSRSNIRSKASVEALAVLRTAGGSATSQRPARVQEHEHEVEQSLGLDLRRRRGGRAGLAAHPPNATRRIRCRP